MLGLFGEYDVVVAGAGVTGVTAATAAARQGARTLLVEGSGMLGGMITAGLLTKPTGPVEGGIYLEMMQRARDLGGGDTGTYHTHYGTYTGTFDPQVMQRAIIEMLEESGVEILLHARVIDVLRCEQVRGLEVNTKSGRRLVLAKAMVDSTGDGDVAALAGAQFLLGRPNDGLTQPMTAYFRVINVDMPRLAAFLKSIREDLTDLVLPEEGGERNEDYVFKLYARGFYKLIQRAKEAGDWRVPKGYMLIKAGLLPGEINVNATRIQGNALDDRTLSRAEIEAKKQVYSVHGFLRKYIPGFESAALLDIAPQLGVRESRRIVGDYLLTGDDVRQGRRFPDSIGLAKSPIDIHDPGAETGINLGVGEGYTVPFRCLLPRGVDGLLIGGRCLSADEVAHASTRNTPVCALTGQAAGTAAALAATSGVAPRQVEVGILQKRLVEAGIPLGL